MAVYTHLGAEELARLIAHYDVGELVSSKGIAEGVSNSNWLVETTRGRFILTMYERRIETADLPFFSACSTIFPRRDARCRARSMTATAPHGAWSATKQSR